MRLRGFLLVVIVGSAVCCTGERDRSSGGQPLDRRTRPNAVDARSSQTRRIAFSILEDYDKGDDIADVRRDFALFRELGITTWRGSFGWDDFEPSRGVFDFAWLHRFANAAEQDGITLRPYVAYTPQWASAGGTDADTWNDPPASLDDWGLFIRELARALRQHPNVRSLEIYNEENVAQWWDGTPAQYRAVLERASREIHAANARLQVVLGGMVYPDTNWLDEVCGDDRHAPFDILPFHAYPETWTPPGVDLERYLGTQFETGFVHAADEACGRLPIWINETGFATTDGVSEETQAAWWARAITTFAAEPRVDAIGVYEIKDLRPDRDAIGGAPNYHLGLLHVDRSRKLAFSTVQMLASMLAGGFSVAAPATRRLERNGGELFSRGFALVDGRQLLVLWAKGQTVRVDVTPAAPGRTVRERFLDGRSSDRRRVDGGLREVELRPGQVRLFEVGP
jgi:hypothetical protein